MAYRYTDTNKWRDAWFCGLTPECKLLFNFLCDNCDCAGFIEITPTLWASMLGLTVVQVEGALKGLQRGLIHSIEGDCIYLRTFLKHQKNLPINPKNKAHKGILTCFDKYTEKFRIEDVEDFIDNPVSYFEAEVKPDKPCKVPKKPAVCNDEAELFEVFRQAYTGRKTGQKTEFDSFIKKTKDHAEVVFLLLPAAEKMIRHYNNLRALGQFVPQYKNLSTWINQRCWETEYEEININNGRNIKQGIGFPDTAGAERKRKIASLITDSINATK